MTGLESPMANSALDSESSFGIDAYAYNDGIPADVLSRSSCIENLISRFELSMRTAPEEVNSETSIADCMLISNDLNTWPLTLYMQSNLNEAHPQKAQGPRIQLAAAEAAFQMGYLEVSEGFLRHILLTQPNNSESSQLHHLVNDWSLFCYEKGIQEPIFVGNDTLHLQLLGHHHASSFLSIYTQQTSYLCRLPVFQDIREWHSWLWEKHADNTELIFAVTHKILGLIGVVSVVLSDDSGFFYYWIGEEFRGQGYGPLAVSMMLDEVSCRWGINTYYAKAFEFNQASLSGLEKLGFQKLDIRAAAPNHDELFFRRGPAQNEQLALEKMRKFYDCIGCNKQFLRLIC